MANSPIANVPLSKAEEEAYQAQEAAWTGPRLIGLAFGTLAVCLVVLYSMAQVTSETTWSDWLIPG